MNDFETTSQILERIQRKSIGLTENFALSRTSITGGEKSEFVANVFTLFLIPLKLSKHIYFGSFL
jgi:hypothetical protein